MTASTAPFSPCQPRWVPSSPASPWDFHTFSKAQPRAAVGACPALGALLTFGLPGAGPTCARVSSESCTIKLSLRGAAAAPWGLTGALGVPGSPPRLAELAAVGAARPLLQQPGAAVGVPCKTPAGVFSAGRNDVYRPGREDFCSKGSVCATEGKVEGHKRCWEPRALVQAGFGCGCCSTGHPCRAAASRVPAGLRGL